MAVIISERTREPRAASAHLELWNPPESASLSTEPGDGFAATSSSGVSILPPGLREAVPVESMPGFTTAAVSSEPLSRPHEPPQESSTSSISLDVTRARLHPTSVPDIASSPEARSYLKDAKMDFLIRRLVSLCINEANLSGLQIDRMLIDTKKSQEERWVEVVLQVFAPLNLPQGIAFWDAIGSSIQDWAQRLPDPLRTVLDTRIAVFVEPTADDAF